jgi:hypothetical protein
MPKYEVTVTRTLSLTTSLEVRAKTEEEAEEKARDIAYRGTLTWDIADKLDWEEQDDDVTVDNIDEL